MKPAVVVVLAAGEGTRMKSSRIHKTMHRIAGRPLVGHVVENARRLGPEHVAVVVGHQADSVTGYFASEEAAGAGVRTVLQDLSAPHYGTGYATRIALEALAADGVPAAGTVLVATGDTPLLTAETLGRLIEAHESNGWAATVLTAVVPDATGYGRIVRDAAGGVTGIVEHKDATEEQRAITEINSGIFAFDGALLGAALSQVTTDNSSGEEYLTDVLGILHADGHPVGSSVADDFREFLGVNDRVQLAAARRILNDRLLERAMRDGVTVIDPATTWIDDTVAFEPDATVHPNTQLRGRTVLGAGCEVGPNCTLTDTAVGPGATVSNATSDGARIGEGASVGPYAYLRPGTVLGAAGKIGTYVETKNAEIGEGSKVPHLSYVGDATIGEHSNIGAASVFVNYDGVNKHRSTVGSHVKMGSDNMYVAPVTIGDGAYSGAGSVITKDVPPGALAVNRGMQRNVEGWVLRKRAGTASAEAAAKALGEAGGDAGGTGDEVSR